MLWALPNSIISVSHYLNVNLGFSSPSPACLLPPCSEIETEYTISRQKFQWGAKCQLPAHPCRVLHLSLWSTYDRQTWGQATLPVQNDWQNTHPTWHLPQKQNWGLRCFKDALRRGHFDAISMQSTSYPYHCVQPMPTSELPFEVEVNAVPWTAAQGSG